jgi:cell division septum initiation protein DivIVA
MGDEPDSLILRLLRDMRAEMATKSDIADLRSEMEMLRAALRSEVNSLRADVASDIAVLQAEDKKTRKELGEQISGLHHAVTAYHSSVIGHGVLISELEARVRRVELHLDLPSIETN